MSKSFIALATISVFFIGYLRNTEAHLMHYMHKSSRRNCDYGWVKDIENERDKLKEQEKYLLSNNDYLSKVITMNNCKEGYMFANQKRSHYKIDCIACSENHYRSIDNSTCLHCPEGYYSDIGSTECKKSESNSSNVHTLCNKGSIIGSNKFGLHKESCIKCNTLNNKYYMPYDNNHDSCMICPNGSIVSLGASKCSECPIGYYEKDNECIKCGIRTYADKTGITQCKVCSNKNSLAFLSSGGYNCNNSIFYDLAETFNTNIINMDIIFKPLIFALHSSVAFVANYNKELRDGFPVIIGSFVFATVMINT